MIKKFKSALSRYPTGIVCIFSKNKKGFYNAIIVNSFASVSLNPLIVLWSLDIASSKFKYFKSAKEQSIVVLSNLQKKIINDIAYKKDLISSLEFKKILSHSVFSFSCSKYKELKVGDHFTFFLKVKNISKVKRFKPIIYCNKKFFSN